MRISDWSSDVCSSDLIAFDLMRVMQTKYRIDAFQETYFVIDSFDQLFEAMRRNFTPLYGTLKQRRDIEPGEVLPGDRLIVTMPDRRVGPPAERMREGESR